jgi:hypothetical protein
MSATDNSEIEIYCVRCQSRMWSKGPKNGVGRWRCRQCGQSVRSHKLSQPMSRATLPKTSVRQPRAPAEGAASCVKCRRLMTRHGSHLRPQLCCKPCGLWASRHRQRRYRDDGTKPPKHQTAGRRRSRRVGDQKYIYFVEPVGEVSNRQNSYAGHYFVEINLGEQRRHRAFSVKQHGGKEEAFAAALLWRDEQCDQIGIPIGRRLMAFATSVPPSGIGMGISEPHGAPPTASNRLRLSQLECRGTNGRFRAHWRSGESD